MAPLPAAILRVGEIWSPPDLSGQVAVVTGASRGIGRGIAEVLAESGAKVYLVARSLRQLEEVASGISERGGAAVVTACDVSDDDSVVALFERVRSEDGHLEILVNNAVGWETGNEPWMYEPPWRAPRSWFNQNFTVGVRSHWLVTNVAAPLLVDGRRGVVLFTSERQPPEPGAQELVLDLRATACARLALLFSLHLKPHKVASLLLYPGFTRTDAIVAAFEQRNFYFEDWTEEDFLARTASPHYGGRAAASLAADPALLLKTGQTITAHEAAVEYGFTDTTGRQPDPA